MRFSSLRGKTGFQRVLRDGKRIGQGFLQLRVLDNKLQINRLGILIPAKVIKKSVDRNRIRRLIKEAFKDLQVEYIEGYDIVVMVKSKPRIDHMHFVRDSVIESLESLKLNK